MSAELPTQLLTTEDVAFRNGDNTDFSSANLICLPIAQVSLLHYRRRYPKRVHFTLEQRHAFWSAHTRTGMRRRRREFVAHGLNTRGEPRKRLPYKRKEAA